MYVEQMKTCHAPCTQIGNSAENFCFKSFDVRTPCNTKYVKGSVIVTCAFMQFNLHLGNFYFFAFKTSEVEFKSSFKIEEKNN